MPILRLDNLLTLLEDLVCQEGCPHTSLLVSRAGAVIASQSTPSSKPFPQPSLSERGDEERARTYAAVASTTWEEERPAGKGTDHEPLMLETELGRMAVVGLGAFLLILVGSEVSPWKAMDKKVRAAEGILREPLISL